MIIKIWFDSSPSFIVSWGSNDLLILSTIAWAVKNPEFINEINKIQDSLTSAKNEIITKSTTIKEKESQLEAEKFTRLEIEKKSLEERLIFETITNFILFDVINLIFYLYIISYFTIIERLIKLFR